MTPRQIRAVRVAERFMPRLWEFSYPMRGRRFKRLRMIGFRAWAFAFKVRVQLFDV